MKSRGVILIITLWIMAILILFVFGLGFRMSLEARLTDYHATEIKNLYRAKAAVNMLKAVISADGTEAYDYLGDNWSYNEELFKDIEVGKNGGTFTISYVRTEGPAGKVFYGAMDEESKININTATKEILVEVLKEAGEEENTEDIAGSILAWRGDSSVPHSTISDDDTYYSFLDFPYLRKGALFDSKEELLLVRGMNPAIYESIRDMITIYGKTNMNTAGSRVLGALGLTGDGIDEILTYRADEDDEEGTEDDGVFERLEDITGILSDNNDKTRLSNLSIDFTSNHFRAHITAKSKDGKIIKEAEAVVSRSGVESEIVFWYEY